MSALSYYNEPAPLAWDVAAAIFGSTGEGGLYDPSALDTIFQDANGTTPAVPGSPVGLVLDARGEMGPELWDWNHDPIITNDGTAGAYDKTTRTFSNSQAGSSPSRPYFRFITVEIGKRYRFRAKFSGQLNAIFSLTLNSGSTSSSPTFGGISGDDIRANGGVIDAIVSTVGNGIFTLWTDGRTTWDGLILEECSIREVLNPPLSQPTTAARPILARMPKTGRRNLITPSEDYSSGWVGATVTRVGNVVTGNSSSAYMQYAVAAPAGSRFAAFVTAGTSDRVFFGATGQGSSPIFNLADGTIEAPSSGWSDPTITPHLDGYIVSAKLDAAAVSFRFGPGEGSVTLHWVQVGDLPYQRVTNAFDVTEEGVPDTYSLVYDLADDNLTTTLPQAINGDLLIAGTKGSIIEPVNYAAGSTFTIGPDTYTGGATGIMRAIGDIVGVVLIDRTLTQTERENLLRHYRGKGASDDIVSPTPWLIKLSNPDQPTPYFIESWTSRDFAGFNMRNPDGVGSLPTDGMLQHILEFTVSGSAGSQTLTISAGDESKGQGTWAAVVQHDDNTWGCYMVSSLGSGTCTIWPNLRANVTAKTLRNLGGTHNGQHYTEPGYRALAQRIFSATRADAYRVRYVDAWNAQTGLATDWGVVGGLGTTQKSISIANNYINRGRATAAFTSRSRRFIGSGPTSPRQGKGLTKTFALQGRSGVLEAFASRPNITNTDDSKFYPFRYVAQVDGVPFHDETYTENDGLVRIFKAFPAGSVGTVTITPTTDDPAGVIHDDVTWWTYDRLAGGNDGTDNWNLRALDINAKTVVYGDSWTTFYETAPMQADGVLGRELQALMAAAGGSGQVIGAGKGGQTAEWGLANFDARVAPHNPKQVLILFFTNDGNQYGDYGYARWMTAMFKIGRKCQMIGANPIFIMPSQTSSIGQSIRHGIWASALGKGLRLE